MNNKKIERVNRKIYPDFENITPSEINKSLERFGISINFLFDDGIEFIYDQTLDIRYFPGDISFIDNQRNIVILSYIEGFSSIDFFIGGDWDDETDPYLTIPIFNFLENRLI
jgi:hypothetical protein